MTPFFHLSLVACLALAVVVVARRPRTSTWLCAGFVLAAVGVLASAVDGAYGGGPFHAIQGLAWTTFAYLPSFLALAGLVVGRAAPRLALASLAAMLVLAGVGAWAFFVEPERLEVGTVQIQSPDVDRAIRIAVLADLQTDRVGPYEERVLDTIDALDADLVLLAGDYFQVATSDEWRELARALRPKLGRLDAPLGAWAVSGDTEPPYWAELFDGTPVRAMRTGRTIDLGPLLLTGVDAPAARRGRSLVEPTPGRFHVLLAHPPDVVLAKPPVDLVVAGHVHGGQVRLPFLGPLVTFSSVPRDWAVGHTELPWGGDLVVSRGVGMERGAAPRLRFLCRPEIVVIEVRPTS